MLRNPQVFTKAMDHEITHALDNSWYRYLDYNEVPADQQLATKLSHVASSCIAMNKLVLSEFIDENREAVATSFDTAADSITNSQTVSKEFVRDYSQAMHASADAIRSNDPSIYDAPGLSDPTCRDSRMSSIASSIATQNNNTESAMIYQMSLMSMQGELNSFAEKAYNCIKEGNAMSELYNDITPINAGHPQDNPTEMASSIVTTLLVNPHYFAQCIEQIPPDRKEAFITYMSAEIDVMNYVHPELITILRSNTEIAEILDRYIKIDK